MNSFNDSIYKGEYVVFDMDDTLCHFMKEVEPLHTLISKTRKTFHEFHSTDFKELVGPKAKRLASMVLSRVKIENLQFDDDAKEFVSSLRKDGFKIAIVTARGAFKDAEQRTRQSLIKNEVEFDDLQVVNYTDCKVLKSSRYQKVCAVFEDSPTNLVKFSNINCEIFIKDQNWNRHLSFGHRFNNFKNLKEKFDHVISSRGEKPDIQKDRAGYSN